MNDELLALATEFVETDSFPHRMLAWDRIRDMVGDKGAAVRATRRAKLLEECAAVEAMRERQRKRIKR
jgi:hypothetical protein